MVDLKHKATLEELAKDRDALRESRFTRLRNDAINEAIIVDRITVSNGQRCTAD